MDVTNAGTAYKTECTPKALEEFLNACKKIDYESTQIILGHPSDLLKMDMDKFSAYHYFISNHDLKQGELLLVKDSDLKEMLYAFVKNNPDRVFRGKQGLNENQ